MPLLSFTDVSIAFGLAPLLERASFQIEPGERVCLIGRNGAGKSTLLRLVDGEIQPDAGEVWRAPTLRMARLAQELPVDDDATVFDRVAGGLARAGQLLAEYHRVSHAVGAAPSLLRRMETLHNEIDAQDAWSLSQRVDSMLARLALRADATLGTLSGGWRRRVALARALVGDPDLLLLDEPTNHLDVEVIQWLEDQLLEFRGGVLFVTHDRALLARLATRIVELDRGVLTSWPGNYARFLERKAAALEEEDRRNALFDRKLAQEEAWIRRGIKARRTRNEGRVRALEALREERRLRREAQGLVRFGVDDAQASGKLVIEAQDLTFGWPGRPLLRNFSTRIQRGDRIGLVGPNGAGKTTLLRLLLCQLAPTSGRVRLGTRLEIAYYDQLRAQLDLDRSVIDNVAGGRESVEIGGERRHVLGYLQDFLFSPERARTPVGALSGGERNRLLLARLFAQPANLLVLDEPTNDLDLETLELLEDLLLRFAGTILLVSHDRAFLDNVVTSTLAFEGDARVREYVGGYADWLRQRPAPGTGKGEAGASGRPTAAPKQAAGTRVARLGHRERRELEELPARIESLETEQRKLSALAARPELYKGDPIAAARALERLTSLGIELEAAYARWDELETRAVRS